MVGPLFTRFGNNERRAMAYFNRTSVYFPGERISDFGTDVNGVGGGEREDPPIHYNVQGCSKTCQNEKREK